MSSHLLPATKFRLLQPVLKTPSIEIEGAQQRQTVPMP